MKICVIGNSHLASVHKAWQKLENNHSDVALTFFAHSGNFYDHFEADTKRGVLTMSQNWIRKRLASSSGGQGEINFNDYDACLIVGGFWTKLVKEIGALGGAAHRGYSKQVIEASAKDLLAASHVGGLFGKIREISDIPVYFFHDPIPAHPKGAVPVLAPDFNKIFDYPKGIDLLNWRALPASGIVFVRQPDTTLAAPNATKYELSVGERKPFPAEIEAGYKGDMKEDRGHMKTAFGEICLQDFLDRLKSAT